MINVWNWNGTKMHTEKATYNVQALHSQCIYKSTVQKLVNPYCADLSLCFIQAQLFDNNGHMVSSNEAFLTNWANTNLRKANIRVLSITSTDRLAASLTIQSDTIAPFVFLETPISGRFSDNGFLIYTNQTVQLTFFGWENFSIGYLSSTLRITSLADTYLWKFIETWNWEEKRLFRIDRNRQVAAKPHSLPILKYPLTILSIVISTFICLQQVEHWSPSRILFWRSRWWFCYGFNCFSFPCCGGNIRVWGPYIKLHKEKQKTKFVMRWRLVHSHHITIFPSFDSLFFFPAWVLDIFPYLTESAYRFL